MTTKILLIHGIGNEGNTKGKIEHEWESSIEYGMKSVGLSMPGDINFKAAFYGDLLCEETESWGQNEGAATPMSASSPESDFVDSEVVALYREYLGKFNVTNDQVRDALGGDGDPQFATRMAKGVHKAWLKAMARALERVLPTRGRYVARVFLRQAAAYLEKPGLKERIEEVVKKQIFDDVEETANLIVISHSLGTVVSYSLLRRLRREIKAKLLLTLGSPLGLEIVKKRLGAPLVCPSNVSEWVNVSDHEDFVALHPTLNQKTFGCDKIHNYSDVDNGNDDAHSVTAYLGHGAVATAIYAHL